jgi:hypothetical protein
MIMMSRAADEGAFAAWTGMPAERWSPPRMMSDPRVPDPAPDPSAGAARGPPQSEPIDVPSPVPDNAPPPNEPTGVPPILPPEIRVIPNTTAKSQHHWNLIRIGDPSRCRRGPPRR